jgi:hypothetical protein
MFLMKKQILLIGWGQVLHMAHLLEEEGTLVVGVLTVLIGHGALCGCRCHAISEGVLHMD